MAGRSFLWARVGAPVLLVVVAAASGCGPETEPTDTVAAVEETQPAPPPVRPPPPPPEPPEPEELYEFPVYPNSERTVLAEHTPVQLSATYVTEDPAIDVAAFYRETLTGEGWSVFHDSDLGETLLLIFRSPGEEQTAALVIARGDQTEIAVTAGTGD
jgi:hypothetical protein